MRMTAQILLSTLILAGVATQPLTAMAQQRHTVQGSVKSQQVYRKPMNDDTREVLMLPVRVVSGALHAPVGAIGGMAKRTGDSVEWVNERTFRQTVGKHQDSMHRPGKVLARGAVMVPVGVVGTAAALPVGVSYGALEGAFQGFTKGFNRPEWE